MKKIILFTMLVLCLASCDEIQPVEELPVEEQPQQVMDVANTIWVGVDNDDAPMTLKLNTDNTFELIVDYEEPEGEIIFAVSPLGVSIPKYKGQAKGTYLQDRTSITFDVMFAYNSIGAFFKGTLIEEDKALILPMYGKDGSCTIKFYLKEL